MRRITIILSVIILLLGGGSFILYRALEKSKKQYSISRSNEKAYALENTSLKEDIRVFQFNTSQLSYLNDSLTTEMNKLRKEIGIKDKNIKQMQYLASQAQKRDTITYTDTIFVDPALNKDTIVGDEWYQIKLGLRYPNVIITDPTFVSEKYLFMSSKKETINPPKKFFLLRWFQKKHTVVQVDIIEKNPHIKENRNRFIEIIR